MAGGLQSDGELLAAIESGDLDAIRELYERHAAWLSIRLLKRCNDPEVVADALQDTFVAAWRSASTHRGDGEVAAWLWGIGIRRLVSRLRRRRDMVIDAESIAEQMAPGAEEQVLLSVEYGDVGQALGELSPELRAVVRAVVLDGLTTKEAARLLRMPRSSVKTRLSRAKVQLRAALVEGV